MASGSESILGKIKDAFLAFFKDGVPIVEGVLKFIFPFLPTPTVQAIQNGEGALDAISSIIASVEATNAATGAPLTSAQKAAAAAPGVSAVVQAWLKAKYPGSSAIKDPTGFAAGINQVISGLVSIENATGN